MSKLLKQKNMTTSYQATTSSQKWTSQPTYSSQREQVLDECPKRYYYQYTISGGWDRAAPSLVQTAYHLKQLTTEDMYLGEVVHRRIRKILEEAAAGEVPNLHTHILTAKSEFRIPVAWGSVLPLESLIPGRPKFICQQRGAEPNPHKVAECLTKIEACLHTFMALPQVLELLSDPQTLLLEFLDPKRPFFGHELGVPAYLKLDAASRHAAEFRIWDWKTGSESSSHRTKGLMYEIFLRRRLGLSEDDSIQVHYVYLNSGVTKIYTYDDEERADRLVSISEAFGEFERLARKAKAAPDPAAVFRAFPGKQCRQCPFQFICPNFAKEGR